MIQEEQLSDYQRGTCLGHGGQAVVYKYQYPQTNEFYAVKILRTNCLSVDDPDLSPKEKEWVSREVMVTSGTAHVRNC